MSNREFLAYLQSGISHLLEALDSDEARSSETKDQFSLRLSTDIVEVCRILNRLAPYSELYEVGLSYDVQNASGSATLTPDGLRINRWREDPDLSPPPLPPEATAFFDGVAERLAEVRKVISTEEICDSLQCLAADGASVCTSLNIFFDKSEGLRSIGFPTGVQPILYVSSDKFAEVIHDEEFGRLDEVLGLSTEETLIVMLASTTGIARGDNLRIIGLDHWLSFPDIGFRAGENDRKKVRDALRFRREEVYWELPTQGPTPFHLHVDDLDGATLQRPDILETVARQRDRLSVAWLAERAQIQDGAIHCEFRGYNHVEVALPALDEMESSRPIFSLFTWAYENASSDKLNIVRQIISLQPELQTSGDYTLLSTGAARILGTAKSNFQIFLSRSVELYFDKRLKVSGFLQEFSKDVTDNVSELTSELVSNLYKTMGVILGVVIAALIDPDLTNLIAAIASYLYLAYLIFILIYLLPSMYLRFHATVQEYKHNVLELRDVLAPEEITRLEGDTFERECRLFKVFFWLTALIYGLLAGLAHFSADFFWAIR